MGLNIGAPSRARNTSWTASASPASFMPERQPNRPGKPIETKACFPLGRWTVTRLYLSEKPEGVEIEVAAEQRAFGGAVLGIDDQRRAGEAAAVDVGQQVAQQAQVAVDARLLGDGPHLLAMIGGNLRHQRLAHFEVFRQAVFAVRPLQQLLGIIGELLDRLAGEGGLLAADFLGRAGRRSAPAGR